MEKSLYDVKVRFGNFQHFHVETFVDFSTSSLERFSSTPCAFRPKTKQKNEENLFLNLKNCETGSQHETSFLINYLDATLLKLFESQQRSEKYENWHFRSDNFSSLYYYESFSNTKNLSPSAFFYDV